jgi:hypothetical protein
VRYFFIIGILFFIALGEAFAAPPRCAKCSEIKNQIKQGLDHEKQAEKDLREKRELAPKISENEISKKHRLTSELFVLTAKIETIRNKRIILHRELEKIGCDSCANQKPYQVAPSPTVNH